MREYNDPEPDPKISINYTFPRHEVLDLAAQAPGQSRLILMTS